jgi:hypothetical protein
MVRFLVRLQAIQVFQWFNRNIEDPAGQFPLLSAHLQKRFERTGYCLQGISPVIDTIHGALRLGYRQLRVKRHDKVLQ